jgi:manganese/zinc/iron transport system permease protein
MRCRPDASDNSMLDFLSNSNFQLVLLGVALIGLLGGFVGTFAVLRKRSLMGDALAHSALPGIVLAFLLTGERDIYILLLGAVISGVIGVFLIQQIVNHTPLQADAALGIVLSVFFGLGIVLLTVLQKMPLGNQSGIDKFIFGQAAAMLQEDVYAIIIISVLVLMLLLLFKKELVANIFDADYMQSLGFPARKIDLLLMVFIIFAVMAGLQAVGVVLMAAILIIPAVAARFWTERFNLMLILAIVFGIIAGVSGTFISFTAPKLPTGPLMVLAATAIFIYSALFAPKRGVVAGILHNRRKRRLIFLQHILRAYGEHILDQKTPPLLSAERVADVIRQPLKKVKKGIQKLLGKGHMKAVGTGFELTGSGREEAIFIAKSHRLWEHYLLYRDILKRDHLDAAADEIEHILTPEIVRRLEEILATENGASEVTESLHNGQSKYERGAAFVSE